MKRSVIVAQRLARPIAVLTVAGSMKVGQVFTPAGIVTVLSTRSHTKYSYVVGGYEFIRTDVHVGKHLRPSTASIERIAQNFACGTFVVDGPPNADGPRAVRVLRKVAS